VYFPPDDSTSEADSQPPEKTVGPDTIDQKKKAAAAAAAALRTIEKDQKPEDKSHRFGAKMERL
jgi:hypothetical protein